MRAALGVLALLAAGPAMGQGLGQAVPGLGRSLPSIPGLTAQPETPQQKREFCQRVASAAGRCAMSGGMAAAALTSCLVQSLPAQDSLRVAQAAQSARGNAAALLSECGIGLTR
ncbi:hypothetical protein ACLF3G_09535 [Falsiroseomonas sp. HC035]|uniref:hypothetical protein n=1 Tax=Falsiroseomonas sp. HC035 TaxID=3390999 RepID=UPI003D310D39